MTKLFLLLACAAFSVCVYSQNAPKHSNAIVVKGATIKEAVPVLLSNGYMMDKIDTAFGLIYTRPKLVRGSDDVILQVAAKDAGIEISGQYDYGLKISNRGMKGSALKKGFEEMDRVAKAFNKEVEYKTN